MKRLIAVFALSVALSGCATVTQTWEDMTPSQKQWTKFGASVLVVGAIAAHEMDHGHDGWKRWSKENGHLVEIPCDQDGTC